MLAAEGCIWEEGNKDTQERFVISLGFKGITFLELRVSGARTELHSKWGAIVQNPAWRLVQALSTITSPKAVITIDGFSSHIAPITPEDRLQSGMKVEVRSGALAGLRGTVLRTAAGRRFVVQVDFIQRGASVELDDFMLVKAS